MFHDVTSREEVDELVRWMRYPPTGIRGSTSMSTPMDYLVVPGAEAKAFIDDNMLLIIQIESREGVENISEILAGGGVDVVEIGRGDLSTSYGMPLEIRHPVVLEAVDQVIAACNEHGVAPGINCVSVEDAADMIERGVRCVSYSSDKRILVTTYNDAVRDLSELASTRLAARA
jgi:4-hydroxy-2-oxoheptanedioate aldolase